MSYIKNICSQAFLSALSLYLLLHGPNASANMCRELFAKVKSNQVKKVELTLLESSIVSDTIFKAFVLVDPSKVQLPTELKKTITIPAAILGTAKPAKSSVFSLDLKVFNPEKRPDEYIYMPRQVWTHLEKGLEDLQVNTKYARNDVYHIDPSQLVKVPLWYLRELEAARDAMNTLNAEGLSGINPKIVRETINRTTLSGGLRLAELLKMLRDHGLVRGVIKTQDQVNQLPFSERGKYVLNQLLQNGVTVEITNTVLAAPSTLSMDTAGVRSGMESGVIALYHTVNRSIHVSLINQKTQGLVMEDSKAARTPIKEVIKSIENSLIHEALHAFAASGLNVRKLVDHIVETYSSEAYLHPDIEYYREQSDVLGPKSIKKFSKEIEESHYDFVGSLVSRRASFEDIVYAIETIHRVKLTQELKEDLRELIGLIRPGVFSGEQNVVLVRFVDSLVALLDPAHKRASQILSYQYYLHATAFEEFLAHRTSNDKMDSRAYGIPSYVIQHANEVLPNRWQDFYLLPEIFDFYLN